ncbi:glycosyltransferase family 2 protein [Candidatus Parcubacteria bacterium]|nr:MAG: glycosyltransferase family 2 protein [Candidatus Parcubacteria bacterium]
MAKLFVIIPAFNEADTIGSVLEDIPTKLEGVSEVVRVVVDDGSSDDTAKIARKTGAVVLRHSYNQGVGTAMATGLTYALKSGADAAVNIDADGQFEAEEIKALIKPILAGKADLAAGNRFVEGRPPNMPLSKYWGNKLMGRFVSFLIGGRFQDVSCGFRAYSRNALLNLNLFGKFTYTQEMFIDLSYKGLAIQSVPVKVKYFKERESKVAGNLWKYGWKTLAIIIRSIVYYQPLKFFAYPGIFLMLIGFGFVGFLIGHKLFIGSYSPYKAFGFIGGGLAMFGLLLVLIGLLADILDRVRQTQEKILYFEKKREYCPTHKGAGLGDRILR